MWCTFCEGKKLISAVLDNVNCYGRVGRFLKRFCFVSDKNTRMMQQRYSPSICTNFQIRLKTTVNNWVYLVSNLFYLRRFLSEMLSVLTLNKDSVSYRLKGDYLRNTRLSFVSLL